MMASRSSSRCACDQPSREARESVNEMPVTTLDDLQSELEQKSLCVSLRGGGREAFLFIENEGKVVEISDHEGQWWVEVWDASDDEDAAPAKERFFPTAGQAIDAATCWLFHSDGAACRDGI